MSFVDYSTCSCCKKKSLVRDRFEYEDFGIDTYTIFTRLKISYCRNCGFGFATPEPSAEELFNFYIKDYRSKRSTFYINYRKKISSNVNILANSRSFAQLILGRSFVTFNYGDTFLDLGAGGGESFITAKALFPNCSLHGIELAEGSHDYLKMHYGANCHQSLKDFNQGGNQAKIILMSHTLEHFRLSDLNSFFRQLKSNLSSDGIVIVEVPNQDYRNGSSRWSVTPHLLFFTKSSISLLFENYGFKVLFIDTCGPFIDKKLNFKMSSLKYKVKIIFNRLSPSSQVIIRQIVRLYQRKIKPVFISLNKTKINALPWHSYGDERCCIRLVAKLDH